MAKWEYVLIRVSAAGRLVATYGLSEEREADVTFEALFFELTEDGWELDQLESVRRGADTGDVLWMVLKRDKELYKTWALK